MACPVVKILGRKIILLSGYHNSPQATFSTKNAPKVDEIRKLRQCSRRHTDAVAFGFVAGRWVPAA